jgi:hypothetical protein
VSLCFQNNLYESSEKGLEEGIYQSVMSQIFKIEGVKHTEAQVQKTKGAQCLLMWCKRRLSQFVSSKSSCPNPGTNIMMKEGH